MKAAASFFALLGFELKNRLGRWSALIYFGVYFAISFLLAIAFAGAFKGASVSFGLSNKLALNSPIVINYLVCLVGYLGLLVIAPIFGQSINQDFENGFHQVLFATPVRKSTYFFVRYFASTIACLVILSSAAFAIFAAARMPFIDRTLVQGDRLWFYTAPYLSNVLPNILIFGAIFLGVVSAFKRMAPVYVASVTLFTGWLIAQNITADLENKTIAAMIEPFGLEAASQVVRYWSVAEQSTRAIPLTGPLLGNRLLWGAIGLIVLITSYLAFNPFRQAREKKAKAVEAGLSSFQNVQFTPPSVEQRPHALNVFWQLALSECRQAFSNIYFLIILLCGVLYIFAISGQIGKLFGTETLPVTYHVLEVIGGSFSLFVVILITYYSGELVWKDRDQRVNELIDSKPVSNLFLYLSKVLSLVLLQVVLSMIVLVCCVLIQAFKGYFHFEWSEYFQTLFVFSLPSRIFTCVLALFIQTMARNKYVGHAFVILYFLALVWLPSLGLDHHLYLVGVLPRAIYSDMNHFGTSAWPFSVFAVYWGFFHLSLAALTVLFWRRGQLSTWRSRLVEARLRLSRPYQLTLACSGIGWLLVGAFIFYNTNILNESKTKSTRERESVDYEHLYKRYQGQPQPEITDVKINVDLFPETQSMRAKGHFTYKNRSLAPISEFLLNLPEKSKFARLDWSQATDEIQTNPRLGIRVLKFREPLAPGRELQLDFEVAVKPEGFENDGFSKKLVQNGTFFYGDTFFPEIGYQRGRELEEDKTRRKYGLSEKPRMPDINDREAAMKTYISDNGTWIGFECTVSTSADQIAIAPGYLQKDWVEGGRHFFHYQMDQPILDFYAILSARYEVTRDEWNGIKIEVYHHPEHTVDVPRMINSVKKSLEYYTKNFSPYQYRQVRIIEFPRYETFAQAFPNTIPFSEAAGFIAKVRPNDPEQIDYPFYITAHEVAHQWWAHQVIGANVQGATMLSESLAQYSSLMVQEKEYGPKQMKKFLKYELDRYLAGRSRETKKEMPLMLNENQLYIHYQKGSLVFYALKDCLGEDVVNRVLHEYIRDVAFQDPPFTRSVDLVSRFREAAPADKKYLIEDLFETITFYDNRTVGATFTQLPSGKFAVKIVSENKKLRASGTGEESEVPMKDLLDVGVYDENGELQYLQKHEVKSGRNTFTVEVDRKPGKAGFDPLNKLIDKVSDDNVVKVTPDEVKQSSAKD